MTKLKAFVSHKNK